MSKEKGNKFSLGSKLLEIKNEYNKVIWPTLKELYKETYAVLIVCIFFGLIVFVIDAIYGIGINFLFNYADVIK
jgi:preprotein translocase SecE subunit